MLDSFKRVLVGRPLATSEQEHQRISKTIALAVFSSDAISSTAYATQEILLVVAVGASSLALGLSKLVPISIVVAILLAIVVTSYRQTIFAYPSGGGSYVVSRENLGATPSLVAGASLLVDYILTVAVSVCAGVARDHVDPRAALADERPRAAVPRGDRVHHRREPARHQGVGPHLRVADVRVHLRAHRSRRLGLAHEFGLFGLHSFPTISFADVTKNLSPEQIAKTKDELRIGAETVGTLGLFRLLQGFSSGAVALTGVEAISNGVPAFQRHESRNAAITLVWMGVILGTLFLGVSVLAHHLQPIPLETGESVFSQMGRTVFGRASSITSCRSRPRRSSRSPPTRPTPTSRGCRRSSPATATCPRQLANRGDRLVFSNGVLVLAVAASSLVVIFGGNETKLIPLYAVGVFTSFTLSQTGMVRHHQKEREPGWRRNIVINGVGAIATLIVTLIIATSKFTEGAWVSIVVVLHRDRAVPRDPRGTTRRSRQGCRPTPTSSRAA